MSTLFENRLFSRTFAIDEISRRPQARQIKFKRAFQFLQLLLIQRVYTLTAIACSNTRRLSRQQHHGRKSDQSDDYEVFLGGSCNPTTWRHDLAIPYFSSRSVSYYNPQVANWTPDLVEVEHRAKESAPLLFFVIDHDTRALASMVEVCYLAASGRSIIVVLNPMPEIDSTKFIENKSDSDAKSNQDDYDNACETRRITQQLLRNLNVPVFETIDSALECAAYILENTKHRAEQESRDSGIETEDGDVVPPLQSSSNEFNSRPPSSIVLARSISNKTSYDDPNEFYQQIRKSDLSNISSIPTNPMQNPKFLSTENEFQATTTSANKQLSCSTHESDDDGYGSLRSSNRELSLSNSSIHSGAFEPIVDYVPEQHNQSRRSVNEKNGWLSKFYSYLPFSRLQGRSVVESVFAFVIAPSRFFHRESAPLNLEALPTSTDDSNDAAQTDSNVSTAPSSPSPSIYHSFDIYIAGGNRDQSWLEKFAFPAMQEKQLRYVQRQSYCDGDQSDIAYDNHLRTKSRVLFYLINGEERLSDLTAELAFLIGERKQQIVVYLESKLSHTNKLTLANCERRDLDRSRTYLLDLIKKEHVQIGTSLESSLQMVFKSLENMNRF